MVIPREGPFSAYDSAPREQVDPPCRILIVDDDAPLRAALQQLLRQNGRSFDEAGDCAGALAWLGQKEYDLILLDYQLPDQTGLTLLDWLVSNGRDEAVVMISGEDAMDAAIGALRRGVDDFIRKPYHIGHLKKTVQGALHRAALERANRAMRESLQASERLHRHLVESSPDLIFSLNTLGEISYVNPRLEDLLGFEREEVLGHPFTALVVPEDRPRVERLLADLHQGLAASNEAELSLLRNPGGWPDGEPGRINVALDVAPIFSRPEDDGSRHYLGIYGVARDLSERKRAEEILTFQTYHDQLTRLPNRILLRQRLDAAIAAARLNGRPVALLSLDIDRFHRINDNYGHNQGDALLRAIAQRLQQVAGDADTLARLGSDEFFVLLKDVDGEQAVEQRAQLLLDQLARPYQFGSTEFHVSACVGIAMYPAHAADADTLARHATAAVAQAKRVGRHEYRFFESADSDSHAAELNLEHELRLGLERDELTLHFQPQVSLSRRRVVGVEALVRWQHPERGLLGPNTFINLAEESGLIGAISRWVLNAACAQLAAWRAHGHTELKMSFNLSPRDFEHADMAAEVLSALQRHQLPPEWVEIEITESMMMHDTERTATQIRELREAGVGVSVDDFGTGYSSLAYLQQFPVSSLKIDRSFVRDLPAAGGNHPIVAAIVGIARGFGLNLVVEGVEQIEQLKALHKLGCDVIQGYHFARPLPATDLEHLLGHRGLPAERFP